MRALRPGPSSRSLPSLPVLSSLLSPLLLRVAALAASLLPGEPFAALEASAAAAAPPAAPPPALTIRAGDLEALEAGLAPLTDPRAPAVPAVAEALALALSAADLGHDAGCRGALRSVASGSPPVRAMAALHALEVCRPACWQALGKVANARGRIEAGPEFVAACDVAGPEPVFGAALAPLLPEMEPAHLVLFRALLRELKAALGRAGSPRARALWAAIERWLPALVAQSVVVERESHAPAVRPPPFEMERERDLPPSRRAAAPLCSVSRTEVRIDGAKVVATDAVVRGPGAEAFRIAGLASRLERWRLSFRARHPAAPAPERLVLRPDGDVGFAVLARVAYTAAQVGLLQIELAVPLRDRNFRRVRWSGQLAAPLVLALAPPPARVEWDDDPAGRSDGGEGLPAGPSAPVAAARGGPPVRGGGPAPSDDDPLLSVRARGFTVLHRGSATVHLPDIAGRPDEAGLRKALGWLRKQRPGALRVGADDAVPYRRLLAAINLALEVGYDQQRLEARPAAAVAAAADGAAASDDDPPPALGASDGKGPSIELGALGPETVAGPRPGTPLIDVERPTILGGLSPEAVDQVIARRLADLRACYGASLVRFPRLAGRVVLQIAVGAGGAVASVALGSPPLRDPALAGCFQHAARRWSFPMPAGGAGAVVTAGFKLYTPAPLPER